MNTQSIFITVGLILTAFLFWQEYQSSKISVKTTIEKTQTPNEITESTTISTFDDLPKVNFTQTQLPKTYEAGTEHINIQTNVLDLNINLKGGTIDHLYLKKYPLTLEKTDNKVQLFNKTPKKLFLAQSGLIPRKTLPTHHSIYQSDKKFYQLDAGQQEILVPLYWRSDVGVEVVKTYRLQADSYLITLDYKISNRSDKPIYYASYVQLLRANIEQGNLFLPTYSGGAIYGNDIYEKVAFEDFASQQPISSKDGWLAMVEHYFVSAWIPEQNNSQRYNTKVLSDGKNLISALSQQKQLNPNESIEFSAARLYAGPKLQSNIDQIKGLDKTVDYGVLYIIAKPLELVLHWLYQFIQSWGWAIILLTILIKLIFYKLSETSYRSMAKMRKLTPKMQHIKERYGDDRQKVSQKMMALYKQEKVNPASGCLPIIIQIPVFIALYWVLLESVELRQVSFWWLPDLSTKDPYFILPIIMGLSMFIQQKLNPTPPDPVQAKIMTFLPIIFTIFFLWIPSGLVLYWLINNLLSILQQWAINKRIAQ